MDDTVRVHRIAPRPATRSTENGRIRWENGPGLSGYVYGYLYE
jgi:hypothetical protein